MHDISPSHREPRSRSSRCSSPSAARRLPSASGYRAPRSHSSAARTAPYAGSRPSQAIASQGIANFPDKFSSANNLFSRKFNCTGRAVQARRVEAGVFEVRFVGISGAECSRERGLRRRVRDREERRRAARSSSRMHPAGRDDRADLGVHAGGRVATGSVARRTRRRLRRAGAARPRSRGRAT